MQKICHMEGLCFLWVLLGFSTIRTDQHNIYRIITVLKIETDIIVAIAASAMVRAVIVLKIKMWKVNGRQTTDATWWQKLTLPLARWAETYWSVLHQIHYDATDKNNNISFEGLNKYYHSSRHRTRCYSNSFCPDPLTNMATIGNSCFWMADF
jgi:hypothetical protein